MKGLTNSPIYEICSEIDRGELRHTGLSIRAALFRFGRVTTAPGLPVPHIAHSPALAPQGDQMSPRTGEFQEAHVDADPTAPKQQIGTPFQPGQSGNPAGRPKGARNKLGEAFIQALQEDFDKHGVQAVETVRTEKPDQYLKVIASLLPKEHRFSFDDQFSEMTDDELAERIRNLAASIAPFLDAGTGGDGEDAARPEVAAVPSRVH